MCKQSRSSAVVTCNTPVSLLQRGVLTFCHPRCDFQDRNICFMMKSLVYRRDRDMLTRICATHHVINMRALTCHD